MKTRKFPENENLQRACEEGFIYVTCPQCERKLIAEPDAKTVWCDKCKQIVTPNDSLIAQGLI